MGLIITKGIGTVTRVVTPYVPEVVNDLGEVVTDAIAETTEQVDALIFIKGTNVQLEQVYARLGGEIPKNGKKQPVNASYYQNEADYNNGVASVELNLETDFGAFDVPQGEYQGIQLAHTLFANKLISLGYSVEIIL